MELTLGAIIKLICIFFGGGVGAATRFSIGELIRVKTRLPGWIAILVANILGSFLIGLGFAILTHQMLITTMQDEHFGVFSAEQLDVSLMIALILTGFCGALTTFSSFSIDTLILYQQGKMGQALANVIISVLLAAGAVLLGIWVGGGF